MSKFSDLAAPLAEKFKMTQKEADQFLSAMTDVLNDGLRNDKLVKIKGLGTFKVASVSARKSVNVNTGEPIVIEGREKISFTPDASLKERVNSPFSQFETTVVNEGVDFSAIDKKIEKPEAQKTEVPTAPTAPTAPEAPSTAPSTAPSLPPPSGGGREGASPSGGGREGASPSGGDGGRLSNPSSRRLIYGTVALLLLLVVFGAFYFLRDATQSSPKVATTKSATPHTAPAASHTALEGASKGSRAGKTKVSPSGDERGAAGGAPSEAVAAAASMEDLYPVLKYGAYAFDGVAAEVTVRKGQTIKSISKTYLGPGAEQYVEAFNRTKTVKEGDVIKIPKLVLKKKKH